jgi:putative glutamine amidotransferase
VKQVVIGITNCSKIDDYVSSVEQAGARARVLEISESPRRVLNEIHGLLLTGGGDVDPIFYGEDRHPSIDDAEPGRDEFEIDLARRAMSSGMAILAICRGAQVLNVAAGGTLVQDIPSAVGDRLRHSISVPKDAHAHDIKVTPGSHLESALGAAIVTNTCRVNSRHHQSVGRLGQGLIATAIADDHVIEGIEKADAPFCIGVQWHPENFWRTGQFSPLFDAFVSAARQRVADPAEADDHEVWL